MSTVAGLGACFSVFPCLPFCWELPFWWRRYLEVSRLGQQPRRCASWPRLLVRCFVSVSSYSLTCVQVSLPKGLACALASSAHLFPLTRSLDAYCMWRIRRFRNPGPRRVNSYPGRARVVVSFVIDGGEHQTVQIASSQPAELLAAVERSRAAHMEASLAAPSSGYKTAVAMQGLLEHIGRKRTAERNSQR